MYVSREYESVYEPGYVSWGYEYQYVSRRYECVYGSRRDASSSVLHDPNISVINGSAVSGGLGQYRGTYSVDMMGQIVSRCPLRKGY